MDKSILATRSLRSGRQCRMTKFSGRIYLHVLARFANITTNLHWHTCYDEIYMMRSWKASDATLQAILTGIARHMHDEDWPQKRVLTIYGPFSGNLSNPFVKVDAVGSARWIQKLPEFFAQMKTFETLKDIRKNYAVNFEGDCLNPLIEPLNKIIDGEPCGNESGGG